MSEQCRQRYGCPMTRINIVSTLEGNGDCCVEQGAQGKNTHDVELSNLGSGRYELDVMGKCESPLAYPNSEDPQSWNARGVKLGPTLKLSPVPITWNIEAASGVPDGREDREISVTVTITKRITKGGREVSFTQDLPPDEPLAFRCRVR